MTHAVVVFSFPEPTDNTTLGMIIESAKKSFSNMEEVKIHLGIRDVADTVISVFDPLHKEDGNLVKHAKQELAIIDSEDDEFDKSIIAAIRGFSSYGHSGGSAAVATSMIHELLQFHNLSSLTGDPKEWMQVDETVSGSTNTWQSRRNPEAFSTDGGKTYYLLSEGGNQNNPNPVHFSAPHIPKPVELLDEFLEDK